MFPSLKGEFGVSVLLLEGAPQSACSPAPCGSSLQTLISSQGVFIKHETVGAGGETRREVEEEEVEKDEEEEEQHEEERKEKDEEEVEENGEEEDDEEEEVEEKEGFSTSRWCVCVNRRPQT